MATDEVNDTVIISVDESAFAERAFDWYGQHMHRSGNHIVLVHCLEMPSLPSRDSWDLQQKEGRAKARGVEEKYAIKLGQLKAAAKFITDFEKPGEYICLCAKQEKADYIVMGSRGMGKLRRTILGSVSNYVLNHADCPVMVCKGPKDKE